MGAVSLEMADGWVQPWRIPHEERALYPPDALRERAAMPAGVRLREIHHYMALCHLSLVREGG